MPSRKQHLIINDVELKYCAGCYFWHSLERFSSDCGRWDGLYGFCKGCKAKGDSRYYRANIEKKRAYDREYAPKYRKAHLEQCRKTYRDYYKANLEKWRKYHREWKKQKCYSNPAYRLNKNLTTALGRSLRRKANGNFWEALVGFTLSQLIKHLEKQFRPGMSWDNHGTGWEIDHIIPISAFNITSINCLDFKRCWKLQNLRPVWAIENRIKHNKVLQDFQPALPIEPRLITTQPRFRTQKLRRPW